MVLLALGGRGRSAGSGDAAALIRPAGRATRRRGSDPATAAAKGRRG